MIKENKSCIRLMADEAQNSKLQIRSNRFER